jgi:hypothetical protein
MKPWKRRGNLQQPKRQTCRLLRLKAPPNPSKPNEQRLREYVDSRKPGLIQKVTSTAPISAAVILADKSDVHRSRVRRSGQVDIDIHDRVNSAVEQSFLRVDSEARTVTLALTIDTGMSQVMEYFEIFLGRMQMCRHAAERLDARFRLTINGAELA